MDIFAFLDEHEIAYQQCDHPPVYTVAEAQSLVPPMPGANTKNLFVRNKPGTRHLLIVVGYDKRVELRALADLLGEKRLSLASPQRLKRYLGVEPGAVSLLAIVNDTQAAVEVVIDAPLWQEEMLKCHPLANTSTLVISRWDMERILALTGHAVRVLDVPERS